jgi:hypothetical protein
MHENPQTGGTYGISENGEMTLIDENHWYLLPSPDGKLLAGYGARGWLKGLRLFDGDGKIIVDLDDREITCLNWSPDSTSLAYQVGQHMYLWELGQQKAHLVAEPLEDMLDYDECGFTWVEPEP